MEVLKEYVKVLKGCHKGLKVCSGVLEDRPKGLKRYLENGRSLNVE